MKLVNPKIIFTIAKKEFLDNIRNKWIILLTTIFIILIIIFSYVSGAQSGQDRIFGGIQDTVMGLLSINILIIPLIAIILGFSTISGEAESGALNVVLSYPIRRIEVLLGKLFGLGSVLIFSIILGYGLGGIVIFLTVGTEAWQGYLGFIFLSIILGFIYLSLAICISSYCKRRITSIGGGILIFFWGMIYGTVVLAIYYAKGYNMSDLQVGNIPEWFYNSAVFSPGDLNQTAILRTFGINEINAPGFLKPIPIPEFLNIGNLAIFHIIWLAIPIVLAYFFFKRRDI